MKISPFKMLNSTKLLAYVIIDNETIKKKFDEKQ